MVGATNMKNASLGMHFLCSCEPGLEGMHRVGEDDNEHILGVCCHVCWS